MATVVRSPLLSNLHPASPLLPKVLQSLGAAHTRRPRAGSLLMSGLGWPVTLRLPLPRATSMIGSRAPVASRPQAAPPVRIPTHLSAMFCNQPLRTHLSLHSLPSTLHLHSRVLLRLPFPTLALRPYRQTPLERPRKLKLRLNLLRLLPTSQLTTLLLIPWPPPRRLALVLLQRRAAQMPHSRLQPLQVSFVPFLLVSLHCFEHIPICIIIHD